jgi:hypothetical protein
MKNRFLFSILFFIVFSAVAQEITGEWNGLLKVQGIQLRVVFHIEKNENGYTATMDSPDQSVTGIPVTTTSFENPNLKLEIINALIEYTGELKEDSVIGIFKQNGQEFPMDLQRKPFEKETVNRPQEPKKPYPYYVEEVAFKNNNAAISLAGTLTLPKKEGVFPAVILISGSGPQNRDEELFNHKPFLVLADYLTKNGIAVLRYDDRGTAKSTGDFKSATTADFASDVESAMAYLKTRKEINTKKIGLIGHSEGGIIAPMVAARSKDIDFIILLAGTGIRGDKILLLQQELLARASGVSEEAIQESKKVNTQAFDLVVKSNDSNTLKTELTTFLNENLKNNPNQEIPQGMTKEQFVELQVNQIVNPWMEYFIKYDPSNALQKVNCPVLAINGGKDVQVSAKENLIAIENALKKAGNKNVTIKEFPDVNHLFQECTTGLPNEYGSIEQTISPKVLEEITQWIKTQTK